MRTLRLSLAATMTLVLLGGLAGLASAQDEAVIATRVTGEVTGYMPLKSPSASLEGGLRTMNDDQYELEIAWSDPRLPSLKRGRENQY